MRMLEKSEFGMCIHVFKMCSMCSVFNVFCVQCVQFNKSVQSSFSSHSIIRRFEGVLAEANFPFSMIFFDFHVFLCFDFS